MLAGTTRLSAHPASGVALTGTPMPNTPARCFPRPPAGPFAQRLPCHRIQQMDAPPPDAVGARPGALRTCPLSAQPARPPVAAAGPPHARDLTDANGSIQTTAMEAHTRCNLRARALTVHRSTRNRPSNTAIHRPGRAQSTPQCSVYRSNNSLAMEAQRVREVARKPTRIASATQATGHPNQKPKNSRFTANVNATNDQIARGA